jgi:acyl-CoA reductase-like NAD-dependent aldehyde dehydrogenase
MMAQPFTLQNYIDGVWQASSGGLVEDVNPADREVIAEAPRATIDDVDAAVAAARRAFAHWRKVPAPKRGEIIFRAGEILRRRKEELARAMTREMGKVLLEARGDVQEGIDMAYYMAGEGRRGFGYTTHAELPDKFAMAVRDPIGVGAIITPWNFPLAIPTWKIFPALVLGNTLVFKPSSDTPFLAYELVRVLEEAGVPPGVVNLVFGGGATVGDRLVSHPDVQFISLTGSVETGRHVGELAGRGLKRLSLELGGKNAIIVLADANLDLAVDAIVWSAFGTSGQRCTAASRVIVEASVHDALLDRLVARVEALRVGNGLDESVDVGPVINEAALRRIDGYVQIGQAEGARLVCGGRILTEGPLAQGFFYAPTIFDRVQPSMRIATEEIFGPVLSLIAVSSLEEAVEVNNAVSYGLSSSIFTENVNRAFTAMRDLTTGIVYVNHGTTGAEIHLPFGGTRGTGNGHREAGTAAVDFFSEWKAIYVDYSGHLQRAQIDTEPWPQ